MTSARALAEQYVKRWLCEDNEILWERGGHYQEEVEALVALLTQAQRETWEAAANGCECSQLNAVHIGPLYNAGWTEATKYLANWCRQQAQGVK